MAHALGVDVVLVVPFTRAFASTSAEEFVGHTLLASFKAKAVVVGANFRFGAGGRGDISMLQLLSNRQGAHVLPPRSADVLPKATHEERERCWVDRICAP